jgi:RNA polymerase sigma-70 factor (ECF subfamily)
VAEAQVVNGDELMAPSKPCGASSAAADPDALLVRAAQSGDLAAFEELVRRHEEALFRYLARLTGNRSTAEELTQACFVRSWEKLGTFRHEARFKTWLFRIAHSLGINALTRTRPTQELPSELAAAPTEEPSEVLRRSQLSAVVQNALDRLPPEQRACLVLAEYEDMSYEEIARTIGKSVRAVDSLLVRARRNLRRLLEPARRKGLI